MFQAFKIDHLEHFPKDLEKLLDRQRTVIKNITESKNTEYVKVLKPMQDLDEELGLFFTPLSHLNSVMNSDETQTAYEASLPLLSKFSSEIAQNKALFKKIEQIKAEDAEAKTVVSHEIRDFVLSGAKLPEEKKKRMEEISLKLSELSNHFSQNLLDATNAFELVMTDEKDVEGMPQSDIDAAKEEVDGKTVYKFTLQIPSYLAYMSYGPNREHRKPI
jgi:oligopeptidase A